MIKLTAAVLMLSFVTTAGAAEAQRPDFSLEYALGGGAPLRLEADGKTVSTDLGTPGFLDDGAADGDLGQPKSTSKAVVYSLLLPGLGHQYVGAKKTARAFYIVDAVIWTSFVVFLVQGDQREEDYQEFAQAFSGISTTDHSDDFYQVLSEYNSSDAYEEAIKAEGRIELYPFVGGDQLTDWFNSNRVGDYETWMWDSEEHRREFRSQRSWSEQAYRNAEYTVAAAIANRLVASFLVIKATRDHNKNLNVSQQSFYLEFGDPRFRRAGELQTGVSLTRRF